MPLILLETDKCPHLLLLSYVLPLREQVYAQILNWSPQYLVSLIFAMPIIQSKTQIITLTCYSLVPGPSSTESKKYYGMTYCQIIYNYEMITLNSYSICWKGRYKICKNK